MQFLFKLIPPRPTFQQDMTEDELKLMQQHIIYWQELQEKDIAIVYGPVSDPAGAWGLGIIEAESEAKALEIKQNDPTIIAGLNRLEIYPMRAIYKNK